MKLEHKIRHNYVNTVYQQVAAADPANYKTKSYGDVLLWG